MTDKDKREPSLSNVPPLAPSRDEVDMRRHTTPERRRFAGSSDNGSEVTPSRNWFWPLLVLMLIAVSVGLARWNYVLQIQHDATAHMLDMARDRITAVEGRLSTTDDSMSKSGVVMQVQIKELKNKTDKLWEQMDKLWASAWRRNQKELEDQSKQLKVQAGLIGEQKKRLISSQDRLVENRKRIEKMAEQLKTLSAMSQKIAQLEASLKTENKQKQQSIDTLNRVSAKQNTLIERVKANEEWVASINGYRRQLNTKIEQMQRNLDALRLQLGAQGPAATVQGVDTQPEPAGLEPVSEAATP